MPNIPESLDHTHLPKDIPTPRCGYIAIVGRPNVGKSTLLNRILAVKLSITSPKPQTTRHPIIGVKTQGLHQAIYIDTPGLHQGGRQALNRYMNHAAIQALEGIDIIAFVVAHLTWRNEDEAILTRLKTLTQPVILIINMVDRIKPKTRLLPRLQTLASKMAFAALIPVSAQTGINIMALERTIADLLPAGPLIFPDDTLTQHSQRFLAAELIREQLMRKLHREVPYGLTVEIETFQQINAVIHIHALIWLERNSQKTIVIGHKGEQLRQVGQQARIAMEQLFGHKVFLTLWTKLKSGWSNDELFLNRLYREDLTAPLIRFA